MFIWNTMRYSFQMREKLPALFFVTTVFIALSTGCASLSITKSLLGGGGAKKRQLRNEEVVRNFEMHRDQAAYEAALARWEQNDSKGCREGLDTLLARNPRHVDGLLLLAEVNLIDKRPQDALKQADEALRLKPGNARALYTKGLVLDAIGQSTGAVAYYEQAVRAEPENEIYALCYRNARDSEGFGETSSNDVVATAYQAPLDSEKNASSPAHQQGPSLATPANGRAPAGTQSPALPTAYANDKMKKDSDSAETYAHAESAVSVEESLSEGQRALSEGSIDKARIAFHKAMSNQPNNPQITIVAAGAALRTNHPEFAVELLAPSVKHFSKSAAIYRMLGVAYYRLGDFQSSQVALQQALSLDKSSALSYFLMGCTLAKLGQAEAANAHFQQAQVLDPRYTVRR
jgi:tetratricopeptide (TPR) repeat protein